MHVMHESSPVQQHFTLHRLPNNLHASQHSTPGSPDLWHLYNDLKGFGAQVRTHLGD
jgi:hypothetical protein